MPKSPEKNNPSKAIAICGVIGGTIIAVFGSAIALEQQNSGSHGFVLAIIALVLGASAVIVAVSHNKG